MYNILSGRVSVGSIFTKRRAAMSVMTIIFDRLPELSMEEVDAVNGAGIGEAIASFIETANEIWDEVPTEVQAVGVIAAGAMIIGAAVGGPAGAIAGGAVAAVGVLTTGT